MAKTGTISKFEDLIAWQKSRELPNLVLNIQILEGPAATIQ
jgi:hypothetical protein